MDAVKGGDIGNVRLLLDRGADPNVQDRFGRSALMYASGHIDIVKLLLDRGINLNIPDISGDTALMHASMDSHIETVKLLLDKGADPNIVANDGHTALMYAIDNEDTEIEELLNEHIAAISMQAIRRDKMTRRKVRTSRARGRLALSQAGYEYGVPDDVMKMVNSHMRGHGSSDMVDEMPHNMIGRPKKKKKKHSKKRTKKRTKIRKSKKSRKSKKRKSRKHK